MTPMQWLADHIQRYYPSAIRRRRIRRQPPPKPAVEDTRQQCLLGRIAETEQRIAARKGEPCDMPECEELAVERIDWTGGPDGNFCADCLRNLEENDREPQQW
jgi:hypothetical protein